MKEVNLEPIFYLDEEYWYLEFQNNNDFIILNITKEDKWKLEITSNLKFFSYYFKMDNGIESRSMPFYLDYNLPLDGIVYLVGKDYQSYHFNFTFRVEVEMINLMGLENSLYIDDNLVIEMVDYIRGIDCVLEIKENINGKVLPYLEFEFIKKIEENEVIDINGLRLIAKCSPKNDNEFLIDINLEETLNNLLLKIEELIDPRLYKDYLIYKVDNFKLLINSNNYFNGMESYYINYNEVNEILKWVDIERALWIEPEGRQDYLINELPFIVGWNYDIKFRIEYKRKGNLPIWINGIGLKGKWNADYYTNLDFQFIEKNQMVVYEVPITYKIFKLTNIYFDIYGEEEDKYLKFEISYSQDNKISWSNWLEIPRDRDISKLFTISPIKFFNVRWRITRLGDNECGVIILNDIIFEGRIQNITCSYNELGILGIRNCCGNNIFLPTNNNNLNTCLDGGYCPPPQGVVAGCGELSSITPGNFGIDVEKVFNPYKTIFSKLIPLNNQILNQVNKIIGVPIIYYKTAVDANGTDVLIHEYNLKNVVKKGEMNIILPNNTLPDDELLMNFTDMGAFLTNSFEIQITKEEFKRVFGIEMRPEKNDIIFLCNWNRLYEVEFSFAKKKLMGSSLYYSVYIKKYEDREMVNKDFDNTISEEIKKLTDFTNLDIFETEIKKEEVNIKKESQFKNLNDVEKDKGEFRKEDMVIKEQITNYGNIISDYYYDFNLYKNGQNKLALRNTFKVQSDWYYFSLFYWFRMDKLVIDDFDIFNINNGINIPFGIRYEKSNFHILTNNGTIKTPLRFQDYSVQNWYIFYIDFNLLNKSYNFYSLKQIKDGVKTNLIDDIKKAPDIPLGKMGIDMNTEWNLDFHANKYHITNLALYNKRWRQSELKQVVGHRIKEDEDKLILFDLATPRFSLEKSTKPNNKDSNYNLGSSIL